MVALGELTQRAWNHNVQVMVEGPGHMPLNQIRANMEIQQTVCKGCLLYTSGMAAFCGFPEEEYDEVFIILDKMDKIGMDGVVAELLEAGYAGESVEKCKTLFETVTSDIEGVRYMKDTLGEFLEEDVYKRQWFVGSSRRRISGLPNKARASRTLTLSVSGSSLICL